MANKTDSKNNQKNIKNLPCWVYAFFLNLGVAILAIVPLLVINDGYLAMSHDFTAEQIPFNMLMNDAIKNGSILWNWGIDIGSNFLEAFSFYNVGSIFVWLMLIFPAKAIPYVLGPMLIFKFAVAGATSAAYFSRYFKKNTSILLASVLYSFSGFQCCSVVFFHFQDAVALFPLMLIGLEKLVEEKKRGFLAFACLLNVLSNFVFFVGEVLFLVLFYVMKYIVPELRTGKKKIGEYIKPIIDCIIEGALGMIMSAFILLPAINGILGNSRMSAHIETKDWFTMTTTNWLMYIKAFFMPAEAMNYLSSVKDADWMTTAVYLPLIGMVFVVAYLMNHKDWLTRFLWVCAVIAVIPVLNNSFMMFNGQHYHRWFYMLSIYMIIATVRVFEKPKEFPIIKSAALSLAIIVLYVLMTKFIPWDNNTPHVVFRSLEYRIGVFVSFVSPIVVVLLVTFVKKYFDKVTLVFTAFAAAGLLMLTTLEYQLTTDNSCQDLKIYENSYGKSTVTYLTEVASELSRSPYPYRYYFDEGVGYTYYNFAMTNSLPSINSFISTLSASVFEMYDEIEDSRGTWTMGGPTGIRELLSAKYIYSMIEQDKYKYVDTIVNSNGQKIYVYDNENALPLGYTYDTYMAKDEYRDLPREVKAVAMLKTLVVNDEDIEEVSKVLRYYDSEKDGEISLELVNDIVASHKDEVSSDFKVANDEFFAKINAKNEKYAFFGVPYEKFWNVTVNGEERNVININGLMAVKVDAGDNDIHFVYDYKPLKYGIIMTVVGALAMAGYMVLYKKKIIK